MGFLGCVRVSLILPVARFSFGFEQNKVFNPIMLAVTYVVRLVDVASCQPEYVLVSSIWQSSTAFSCRLHVKWRVEHSATGEAGVAGMWHGVTQPYCIHAESRADEIADRKSM